MDIKVIISYYKESKWDDMVNILYNNKDNIIKLFNKYLQDKNNKNRLTEILDPYSPAVLDLYIRNKKIVPSIKFIVLHLIEQYHKLKLKEATEIKNPKTKITYVVSIGDNEIKIKLFILYILIYYLEAEIRRELPDKPYNEMNHRAHVGIDYEFKMRVIALMQINFGCVADAVLETNSYIWLVNPGEFNDVDMNILNTYLMVNTTIYKILHGSDSLDIPYMYNHMFKGDKDSILKFTSKVFDTRFLCEYFRMSVGEDKRCSIYYALEYFNVITHKHHDELEESEANMGPKQDMSWDIRKMSSYHIKYALYDVLFLQYFLINILNRIRAETPQYVNTYKYIIPMIRFMFVDRKEVTDILETAKSIINPINNYLIRYKGKNFTLITVYNTIIENFKIPDTNIDIDFILSVSYFKKSLSVLFKYIVYYVIQENFTIYRNKQNKMENKISLDIIYNKLKENRFHKMIELTNLFKNETKKKLFVLYKK